MDGACFPVTEKDIEMPMPPILRIFLKGHTSFNGEVNLCFPRNFELTKDEMVHMFTYLRSGLNLWPKKTLNLVRILGIFGGWPPLEKELKEASMKKRLPQYPEEDYEDLYIWRVFFANDVPDDFNLSGGSPSEGRYWGRKLKA